MKYVAVIGLVAFLLQGCASSNVSRSAGHGIDKIHTSATPVAGDVIDAYQSKNQAQKGAIMGGVIGANVGMQSTTGLSLLPSAMAGAGVGLIVGGAMGSYIDSQTTLIDRLENRGMKVIVLGDQVMVVLPSVWIFEPRSATLRSHAYSALDLVAEFISHCPNILVSVAGNTGSFGLSATVNKILSEQQANTVVKYLWARGVDTRVISSIGYGSSRPVVKETLKENSDNDRIEITLEKLTV